MSFPKRLLALLALALLLPAAAPEPAEAAFETVGYLVNFSLRGGDVKVQRGRNAVDADRGMPLRAGDQILISGRAQVLLSSNRPQENGTFTAEDSPITITGPPPPPRGVLETLASLFNYAKIRLGIVERPPAILNLTPTKGVSDCAGDAEYHGDFRAAAAMANADQVISARGPLFVAWRGGTPPYRITYGRAGTAPIEIAQRYCTTFADVALPALTPEPIDLVVHDAEGKIVLWHIRSGTEPGVPGGLAPDSPSDLRQLATALQQLNGSGQDRAVDALTRLHAISTDNFLAWRLVHAAIDGEEIAVERPQN
ncbi:hypothetical protein [Sphingomonas sp. ERG5]|uniref:hypothetical protein n=1 Tax=Sphingomonas sp. ERG5 TaxID=1381597 RepID=UPI0013648F59|nr:hypothetical protein [Sphingomonas sp. ERG5]